MYTYTPAHRHQRTQTFNFIATLYPNLWMKWVWKEKKNRKLTAIVLSTLNVFDKTSDANVAYGIHAISELWTVWIVTNTDVTRACRLLLQSIHFQFIMGNLIVKMYLFVFVSWNLVHKNSFRSSSNLQHECKKRTECNWSVRSVCEKQTHLCASYSIRH